MNDKIDINDLEWVAGVADDLDEIANELKEVNKLLKELDDYLEDNNLKKEIYFGFVNQSKDLDKIKDDVQIIRRAVQAPVSSYGYEMDMSIASLVDLCIDEPFRKKMEKTVARLAKADISNYTAENSGGIVVEEETWEPGVAISAPSTRVVKLVTPKRLTINDILSSPFSKAMRKKQYQEYLKLLYPDLSDKSIEAIDTKLLYDMYLKSQLDIADFDYLTQIEEGLNGLRKIGLGLGLATIAIVLSPATAALLGTGATVITVSSTAVNGFLSIVDVISLISGKDINGNELTKAERDSLLASVVIDGAFLAGSIYSKIQLNNISKASVISKADRAKIDGWKFTPNDDLYLKFKDTYDNPSYFNQITGDVIYPGMNGNVHIDGFLNGNYEIDTLPKGMIIDRYGGEGGNFFSPDGASFDSRALPPFMNGEMYTRYEIVIPFDVKAGTVAPWFNQPGMGTQFVSEFSADELRKLGWIKIVD